MEKKETKKSKENKKSYIEWRDREREKGREVRQSSIENEKFLTLGHYYTAARVLRKKAHRSRVFVRATWKWTAELSGRYERERERSVKSESNSSLTAENHVSRWAAPASRRYTIDDLSKNLKLRVYKCKCTI